MQREGVHGLTVAHHLTGEPNMKRFIVTAAIALNGLLFASTAFAALPQCSSNFCAGAQNGGNCQINGAIHTCGKCTGTPNGILYVGDLSASTAEEKCKQHVNKDHRNTIRNPELKKATKATAKSVKGKFTGSPR